jgi:RNA polymerase sigma-70 factor (ECF subfamily)
MWTIGVRWAGRKDSAIEGAVSVRVDDLRVTGISDLERLYRESGDRLWWALFAYAGDGEIASDATAEAFGQALATPDVIRDPAAWVWRVAFRVATAELRTRRRRAQIQETSYEMDERALAVILALDRVSRRQRAVFVLFYLDDRPASEIAELLSMSPATVSVHLHRARRRLRTILGDDDD